MKIGEVEKLCLWNMSIALLIVISASFADLAGAIVGMQTNDGMGWKQSLAVAFAVIQFVINGYYWRYYKL